MNEMIGLSEALGMNDLGDAKIETTQYAPYPPIYPDWAWGTGAEPNRLFD
jgi:hypothetical protein